MRWCLDDRRALNRILIKRRRSYAGTYCESIAAFSVGGLKTRTTNTAEMNPATAQLGRLWSQFFSQDVMGKTPGRTADPRNFGVYAQYESDASGA